MRMIRWSRRGGTPLKTGFTGMMLMLVAVVTLDGQSSLGTDYHQHLFSPATAALAPGLTPVLADDLVKLLDLAEIRRAAVFSVAYQFGNPNRPPVADEYAQVKAENDWTSGQVARFPDRLIGFCGLNPLKDYALDELSRCAKDPHLHVGVKLHFGNSDVDLDNPRHVARLRDVFRAANGLRMAASVLGPGLSRGWCRSRAVRFDRFLETSCYP